jgi:hypothetical protein
MAKYTRSCDDDPQAPPAPGPFKHRTCLADGIAQLDMMKLNISPFCGTPAGPYVDPRSLIKGTIPIPPAAEQLRGLLTPATLPKPCETLNIPGFVTLGGYQ